jgi:ATP phosphoribosyltransferase
LVFGKHPVDLRVEELDGGVEVAPVVGGDEVVGLVDVLLRHGP